MPASSPREQLLRLVRQVLGKNSAIDGQLVRAVISVLGADMRVIYQEMHAELLNRTEK